MKKISITLEDLFNIPTSVIYNPDGFKPVPAVTIDSRNIVRGSLFVAVRGDKFDGHDFVKEALKRGASAVLIEDENFPRFRTLTAPLITVKNTIAALGELAAVWRNKLSTKIIGITGSAGKTTTKEILTALLSEKFSVNKTISNNNNHIGVPLTLFSTNNNHDFLVLELGTNHFGEIKYSSQIARPDFALITNIGNSHLEFLKNKKGVFKEKVNLFKAVVERNGLLFVNTDDTMLKNSLSGYAKKITYGFNDKSDVKGKIIGYSDYGNPVIELKYKSKVFKQILPLYGEQSAKNFLAAAAVALKLGIGKEDLEKATNKIAQVEKRLNIREHKNYLLIDDTYNANPESMKYSLELLGKIHKYKRKAAVLGDMLELGDDSKRLHAGLAALIKKNRIDTIILTGKMMKYLSSNLNSSGIEHYYFADREKLIKSIKKFDLSDFAILVKGSRGMKMEEFVKNIESKDND